MAGVIPAPGLQHRGILTRRLQDTRPHWRQLSQICGVQHVGRPDLQAVIPAPGSRKLLLGAVAAALAQTGSVLHEAAADGYPSRRGPPPPHPQVGEGRQKDHVRVNHHHQLIIPQMSCTLHKHAP